MSLKSLISYIVNSQITGQLLDRIENKKKLNMQKVIKEQQSEKSNTLIFCGVILAMSSIGLLVFVLSEKVFHLN